MWKNVLNLLAYIWQLPQNVLGVIINFLFKDDNVVAYKDILVHVSKKFPGGISLGKTVIIDRYPITRLTWNRVKHEYGHTRQSLYLGPLYLIVIGLPSLIWAGLKKFTFKKINYYSFFTEKWADKLGNVER